MAVAILNFLIHSESKTVMTKKILLSLAALFVIIAVSVALYENQKDPKEPEAKKSATKDSSKKKLDLELEDKATNSRLQAQKINTKKPNWEELSNILNSEDSSTRFLVTTKLGEIRESKSVSLAISQLSDQEQSVRHEAARSIESLTGFEVDEAKLNNPKSSKEELQRVQQWWDANKAKSVNELRLESLKAKTAKKSK